MLRSLSKLEHWIFDDTKKIMVYDYVKNKIPYLQSYSELFRHEIIQ